MTWKLALIMLTVLFVANQQNCHALSFLDAEHGKKLEREAKKEAKKNSRKDSGASGATSSDRQEITSLELFASPIQPSGGSLMCSVNWMNVLRLVAPKLAAKMSKGRSLIELYASNLLECDEDIRELNADPTPDRDYQKKLKELKARKWVEKLDYVMRL